MSKKVVIMCTDVQYVAEFVSPSLCFGPVRLEGAEGLGIAAGLTAVVGPNGAGKSTLMNIICNQLCYRIWSVGLRQPYQVHA